MYIIFNTVILPYPFNKRNKYAPKDRKGSLYNSTIVYNSDILEKS